MTVHDERPLPGCFTTTVGLVAWLLLAGLLASTAHCQDHVLLARTCVSERGWRTDTHDCAAIYETAMHRVTEHGVTIRSAIRALSPRLHGDPCSVGRSWLCDLAPDLHRPAALHAHRAAPRRGGLPSRRSAWEATLVEAAALLTGSVPPVCPELPSTWGSDADLRRRRLAGYRWEEIDCGPTLNHFGRLYRRTR
jgi:hypothetical protein